MQTLAEGKSKNLESIKTMVYKHGPISRQEIATSLNLTLPTITTTVSSYLKTGLFREVEEPLDKTGTRPKQTGRPTLYLEYASTIWYFLGVEFWSGGIGCCLTDIHGNILHSKTATYPSTESYSYENMIEDVGNTALLTIKESGIPKEKVLGLGVGLPGPVNQKQGILYSAGSFDWGENRTAAEDLSQKNRACGTDRKQCSHACDRRRNEKRNNNPQHVRLSSRGKGRRLSHCV